MLHFPHSNQLLYGCEIAYASGNVPSSLYAILVRLFLDLRRDPKRRLGVSNMRREANVSIL